MKNFTGVSTGYKKDALNNMSLLFVSAADGKNCGLDGTMFKFKLKVPENAKKGDVYPIDISYGLNTGSCIGNADESYAAVEPMETYTFAQGIYNMRYNCNFTAKGSDIKKCKALSEIPGCYDGYIAIAD